MKNNKLLIVLAVVLAALAWITYRAGLRSVTILRNDAPAAGEIIERFGPKGIEELQLDEHGALQLPWSLSAQSHPIFLFHAAEDRNYQMKFPSMGHRTYQVWDRGLTRIDVLFELGPYSWTEKVVQEER